MKKKLTFDSFFSQLSSKKTDTETLLKNQIKFINKDKIETTKNKGFFIFLSPKFSSFIRLLSENSFDIICFLKKLQFPTKMVKKKFIENFFLLGYSLVNIIFQCCFFGPDLKDKYKINFSKVFSFPKTRGQILKGIWKVKPLKSFNFEFFSLSKGILIETIGIFFKTNPSTICWSFQLLILSKKIFLDSENNYNFGFGHLLTIEHFENINDHLFLFGSKFFEKTYLKSKKKKIGLYQESLNWKSLNYSNFATNCKIYSTTYRLNFLLKAKFLLNYDSFFTGIFGSCKPYQLHFTPQFSFLIRTKNLKECLGNQTKTISEVNLIKGKFFLNFFKIRKIKEVDFFFPEENFNFHRPLNFYNINLSRNIKKTGDYPTKEKLKNFSFLKLNFLSIFGLNLGILQFYSKFNSSDVFGDFLKKIIHSSFFIPLNLKIGLMLSFLLKKKKILFTEFLGFQLENILDYFFCKKKNNLFFGHFWNLIYSFLSFDYVSIQKSLYSEYIKYFSFDYTKENPFNFANFFLKFDFILGNPKILEAKMRKKMDSIDLKKKRKYFFTIGKTTENEKYFEIIFQKTKKKCWLAKKFIGQIFFRKKKWNFSKKQYTKSLTINSKNKNIWFRLGFVSLKLKDFSTSAKSFLKVIDIEPDNCHAWNNLASVLGAALRKKKEASFILKIALKNESIPFFIFRKFFVISMDPNEIDFKEILDKLHLIVFKKLKKDSNLLELVLKIILVLLEFLDKKILKQKKKKFQKKKILNLLLDRNFAKIYNFVFFSKIFKNLGGNILKFLFFTINKKTFISKTKKFSFIEFPEENARFFLFSNLKNFKSGHFLNKCMKNL
ncbi:hypothetical protein HAN_3g472 (nucleomorph) [Hemiselmis andersenii]|uniref:Uncharacterized protein n=4 Tax=Hemiselmis andersenii TaxID=464988 RepID=A9BL91_HEMAN|nr:hypothetical protein HAN_3g472 [Hemiselmis andersenii]ABW98274.1 hypothetical protein HAN_3g472 [Hemiselmis andersenii]